MPTHDIIDNRDQKLIDHIRRILPGSQAAKFAVGYFFLSGLEAVADALANVQELRLLIGDTTSRQTIEAANASAPTRTRCSSRSEDDRIGRCNPISTEALRNPTLTAPTPSGTTRRNSTIRSITSGSSLKITAKGRSSATSTP